MSTHTPGFFLVVLGIACALAALSCDMAMTWIMSGTNCQLYPVKLVHSQAKMDQL